MCVCVCVCAPARALLFVRTRVYVSVFMCVWVSGYDNTLYNIILTFEHAVVYLLSEIVHLIVSEIPQ